MNVQLNLKEDKTNSINYGGQKMNSKEAIEQLYQEREYIYADKVNSKGENWSTDIKHYDNIGRCLQTIKKDLEVLEVLKKIVTSFEIEMPNGDKYYYIGNKQVSKDLYNKLKEQLKQQ